MTLLCTGVETAISGVQSCFNTGRVPTSLALLFWGWMSVSLVFVGWSMGTSYSSLTAYPSPPPPPHFPIPNKPYRFCGHKALCLFTYLLPATTFTRFVGKFKASSCNMKRQLHGSVTTMTAALHTYTFCSFCNDCKT